MFESVDGIWATREEDEGWREWKQTDRQAGKSKQG